MHSQEPADPTEELYRHPNVLALPHAGVCSNEVFAEYADLLVHNIVAARSGGWLRHQLRL